MRQTVHLLHWFQKEAWLEGSKRPSGKAIYKWSSDIYSLGLIFLEILCPGVDRVQLLKDAQQHTFSRDESDDLSDKYSSLLSEAEVFKSEKWFFYGDQYYRIRFPGE